MPQNIYYHITILPYIYHKTYSTILPYINIFEAPTSKHMTNTWEKLELHDQNIITIWGSIVIMITNTTWPFNEHMKSLTLALTSS